MNGESEKKTCASCQSWNLPQATHCRYCHETFNQAKTFVERKLRRRLNRKLLLAGGSVLAVTARYIFRKRRQSA